MEDTLLDDTHVLVWMNVGEATAGVQMIGGDRELHQNNHTGHRDRWVEESLRDAAETFAGLREEGYCLMEQAEALADLHNNWEYGVPARRQLQTKLS